MTSCTSNDKDYWSCRKLVKQKGCHSIAKENVKLENKTCILLSLSATEQVASVHF